MTDTPDLSFVVVTDSFESIARTVRHLRMQANRTRIELVVVVPEGAPFDPQRSELEEFHSVQRVEMPSIASFAWARAPGVRRATAPFVVFGETHSFAQPGWAEALVAAHAEGWDVVGPGIVNANPATLLSWANLFLDYGRWVERDEPEEMDDLPGHNSSYRRELLAAFPDDELMPLLEAETELHRLLRAQGVRLLLEPRARLAHTNVTRWPSALKERFAAGRRFAAARARAFSAPRRIVYALGSPLIPLVRFRRIVREIRRCGRSGELLPGIIPTLALCLVASALGELTGYVAGSGSSMEYLSTVELNKLPHLRRGDTVVDATL